MAQKFLILVCFAVCIVGIFAQESTCDATFAGFPKTRQFVCAGNLSSQFQIELLGGGRNILLQNFLSTFSSLQISGVTADDRDVFFQSIIPFLINQTNTNPPQYVSHGTDHSVRTMNWGTRLVSFRALANGMNSVYGLGIPESQVVLGFLGLLHDIGYADLDRHDVPKWLHSVASSMMIETLLQMNNGTGYRIMTALANGSPKLAADFIDGVKYHNFDDGFCIWRNNNPRYADKCTFLAAGNPNDPTSKTTPLLNGHNYTRGYISAECWSSPLLFAIRVADNLDAVRSRLTSVQNDLRLMNYFARLYQDGPLRLAIVQQPTDKAFINNVRAQARTRATRYAQLENATVDMLAVMDRANEESFLHFYSNWIIQDTIIDSDLWSIQISLYDVPGSLSQDLHTGPALYQINRLASSAYSCWVTPNNTFMEVVRIDFNIEIEGLDQGGLYPLKSFSKKPIYIANGTQSFQDGAPGELCDPYCARLTEYLTMSPEPCLDADAPTEDCPYSEFGKISPFSDLSYPVALIELESPSPPSLLALHVGLIVGGCFLFVLLVSIGIFVFLYRRKARHEYVPLK